MLTPFWTDPMRFATIPWRELRALQRDLDRVFDGATPSARPSTSSEAPMVPAYDVQETDGGFRLSVDLPGVRPEDVKVTVKDGRLDVTATSKVADRERRFQAVFTLPTDVDDARLDASLEHGVLTLFLPKAAKPEAREIPIRTGAGDARRSA